MLGWVECLAVVVLRPWKAMSSWMDSGDSRVEITYWSGLLSIPGRVEKPKDAEVEEWEDGRKVYIL
jgi:hypothetical protein